MKRGKVDTGNEAAIEAAGGKDVVNRAEERLADISVSKKRFDLGSFSREFRPLLLSVPLLAILTGLVFPVALAIPARICFPFQAGGSLLVIKDHVIGSALIAQEDRRPGDFHPRPSAAGKGYDATASGGTNLGPANPKLRDGSSDDPKTADADESFLGVRQLAEDYRSRNGLAATASVPIDAVTRSGSGLDPHISPENAELQVPRVAQERRLSEDTVRRLVGEHTLGPQLGFIGAARVSVLELNFALDQLAAAASSQADR
jgi:K+-transporting ATPase ATPase C chain